MAGKEKVVETKDEVHQNAIHVENIRKEQRNQRLHTEFSINPHRTLHILPDKPMSRKPTEVITENSDFIDAFHKARQEPTKKYSTPQTESQEIGWVSTPLITSDQDDRRLHFNRRSTEITRHKESALRSLNYTKGK